ARRGDQDELARQREAVADGSRQRGWPPPVIYAENEADLAAGHAPVLARLARCSRNGVTVGFLLPPALAGAPVMRLPAAASPPRPPVLLEREDWAILARARAEALAALFPDWRIWLDQAGWHARRRQDAYLQARYNGAPAYSVHAATPTALAAQLCWQHAADQHAPDGCTTR